MDWRILYNPLAALGKRNGLIAAIAIIIVLTAVAWWGGVHLDGALDLHLTLTAPSVPLIIAESLIAWLSLGILFFAASKMLGGNGGVGAHLAATGLARFPYILAAVVGSRQVLGEAMQAGVAYGRDEIVFRPQELLNPVIILGSLAILALIGWALVLLGMGFKEASRLDTGKTIAGFIIGLILAEVVSKLLITALFALAL